VTTTDSPRDLESAHCTGNTARTMRRAASNTTSTCAQPRNDAQRTTASASTGRPLRAVLTIAFPPLSESPTRRLAKLATGRMRND